MDESGIDPAAIDAATEELLIEQYAQPAWDLAGQWLDAKLAKAYARSMGSRAYIVYARGSCGAGG